MEKKKASKSSMTLTILIVFMLLIVLAGMMLPSLGAARERLRSRKLLAPNYSLEENMNTETYDSVEENSFKSVKENPFSTFSIDVDTASYSNIRRLINYGELPPAGAVRVEEMINYFNYKYPQAKDPKKPFATRLDLGECPWNKQHKLLRIALKGKGILASERSQANLVFLLDVSGSMSYFNKLPLLKKSLKMLINNLNKKDRVAIVVYAGSSGLVLDATACSEKEKIINALERLEAGGSTNGGSGIKLAYNVAKKNFIKGGINRVVLCTDGDFNVGLSNQSDLIKLIEKSAKNKVFLTVLGFGMGNYKDSTLEKLADKGNGNYGYIDSESEARKLLVKQINGTLSTIAKDVKIQVDFNPKKVQAYRLIGYENRKMADEDFNDDSKDAGEIGAGHTVTAFYELVPNGVKISLPKASKSKYTETKVKKTAPKDEIVDVNIRYKDIDSEISKLLNFPLKGDLQKINSFPDNDFRFATAVISFGMLLTDSKYLGDTTFASTLKLAQGFEQESRKEFCELVKEAKSLKKK